MITQMKSHFSVDPKYIEQLKKEIDQFEWLNDFVSYDSEGNITLFDIHDGQMEDAISQVIVAFDDEAIKTVKGEFLFFDPSDHQVSKFVIDGSKEILKKYASDYIWSHY